MTGRARRKLPTTEFEAALWAQGLTQVAGADEAGRGAWAGPVVAAAVILDPARVPPGLDDSKRLSPARREQLCAVIETAARSVGVGVVDADVIDRINILEATRQALRQALAALAPEAEFALLDALALPELALPQRAIVKGDARCASIAAASIVAKTRRDRLMTALDAQYPAYGFARHKGYGTAYHWQALRQHGPCPAHRLTFRGVAPCPRLFE